MFTDQKRSEEWKMRKLEGKSRREQCDEGNLKVS